MSSEANGTSPNVEPRVSPWEVCEFCVGMLDDRDAFKKLRRRKLTGVYVLENVHNDKLYVGMSVNIGQRILSHVYAAKRGENYQDNLHVYNAVRAYGLHSFRVYVLETCERAELAACEKWWIARFDATDPDVGYNVSDRDGIGGFDRHGERHPNHKLTAADVESIRVRRGNGEPPSVVYADYAELIAWHGFQKVWYNRTWTPEDYVPSKKPRETSEEARVRELVHLVRVARVNGGHFSETRRAFPELTTKQFDSAWYGRSFKDVGPSVEGCAMPRSRKINDELIDEVRRRKAAGERYTVVKKMFIGKMSVATFLRLWKKI